MLAEARAALRRARFERRPFARREFERHLRRSSLACVRLLVTRHCLAFSGEAALNCPTIHYLATALLLKSESAPGKKQLLNPRSRQKPNDAAKKAIR